MNGDMKLDESDVLQAAGRGNRSQGVVKATCIAAKPSEIPCQAILNRNAAHSGDAVNIVQSVYECFTGEEKIKQTSKARHFRKQVKEAFADGKWRFGKKNITDEEVKLMAASGTIPPQFRVSSAPK